MDSTPSAPESSAPGLDQTSEPFVGAWNNLVSTTNWEKGRIILEWREALAETDAPSTEFSDDAWSQRVGAVTPQHVGRLRRVYQRFGKVQAQFPGLYWSHFQAALDWEDAEMWLEGAVQNKWSISRMRRTRWETLGGDPDSEPRDSDIIVADTDEDIAVVESIGEAAEQQPRSKGAAGDSLDEGADFGEGPESATSSAAEESSEEPVEYVRPFENLAELPEDVIEAFEGMKLAVLHHKSLDWSEISLEDLLASLDALKELATAP